MKIIRLTVDIERIPVATLVAESEPEFIKMMRELRPLIKAYDLDWIIEDAVTVKEAKAAIKATCGDDGSFDDVS